MGMHRRVGRPYGRLAKYREEDVFTARRIYCFTQRAGVCATVKRSARRRERREGKTAIRAQLADR